MALAIQGQSQGLVMTRAVKAAGTSAKLWLCRAGNFFSPSSQETSRQIEISAHRQGSIGVGGLEAGGLPLFMLALSALLFVTRAAQSCWPSGSSSSCCAGRVLLCPPGTDHHGTRAPGCQLCAQVREALPMQQDSGQRREMSAG